MKKKTTPPPSAKPDAPKELKIDFGCGKHKREGFIGVDILKFEGVDIKLDIGKDWWPWKDNSVDEANASHFVEHLEVKQRLHFVNELHRVLKPGGKAQIVVPHWASCRAYGDPTHVWPPVSEFWFLYLDKVWRETHAPHTCHLFKCNFSSTWGYSLHDSLKDRNEDYRNYAVQNYKEVCQDIVATLTKNS